MTINRSSRLAPLVPLGRLLIGSLFVLAGYLKLGTADATAHYLASGGLLGAPSLAIAVGLFEIVAGLALILGYRARLAACALAVFTFAASLVFHAFWAVPADQQFVQQLLFSKNAAVLGALLFIAAMGAGPFSVDDHHGIGGKTHAEMG